MAQDGRKAASNEPEHAPDPRVLTLLTTEHFTLQGARSATISEGIGRATLYIGALSSTLVALGFLAQASRLHATFYAFAFVALPTVYALGVFTFVRSVEISTEDLLYARAIARIRGRYLQLAGDDARYFMLGGHDDVLGALANMGITRPTRWQLLFTLASMVLVLNAVVAGTTAAMVTARASDAGLGASLGVGVVVALLSSWLHLRGQRRGHTHARAEIAPVFPSPPTAE